MDALGLVAGAVVAGLVGTPHCVGMCGPFVVLAGTNRKHFLAWHGGRILTYAALGALAGGLGASLPGPAWLGSVLSALLVAVFAAAFAGLLPEPRWGLPYVVRTASRLARHDGVVGRMLFGMAGGLLPCGLLYATLGLAVASAGAAGGAVVMLGFGLATTPGLAVVHWGAGRAAHRAGRLSLGQRRWLAGLLLLTGWGAVALRWGMTALHAGHG